MSDSLIGIVMCGGESSRMGSDKGLLRQRGKSWAYMAYEILKHITPEVYLSINPTQTNSYRQLFPKSTLIIDAVECKGPLAGLLSVHQLKPERDILLLACDMIKMDIQTLMMLVNEYKRDITRHDFYIFRHDGEFEPLAGIYTSNGIKKIFTQYQEGLLKKHSMKYLLDCGSTRSIDVTNAAGLTNFNSPSDIFQQTTAFI